MSDIIKLLPDHIANQIAAGEVVQRPASVVKELLENSVDAGAQNIRLIVKDAGKTLIQVVDDGIGMSPTDARMCFERHATSKIRAAEDLFAIRTMGFRGEAMASIAAVAQVEMRTRKREAELGTLIVIEGSEILTQEFCQANAGTSISVKNLFFNIPARRNFLKSNNIEMQHILHEFERVALANPEIFFSLHHNDDKIHYLPKANLRQRIVHLFGNKSNESLIPIGEETDILTIKGFISKPEFAKKTRGEQFFFVNNRFIKSHYLHHAIITAYEDVLPSNMLPLYVIFLELDPSHIDVNVHPTKQEIKFDDEKLIYNYLRVTARHALAQNNVTPSIDFEAQTGLIQDIKDSVSLAHHSDKTVGQQFSQPNSLFNQPKIETESRTSQSQNNNSQSSGYQKNTSFLDENNLKNWSKLYESVNQANPQDADNHSDIDKNNQNQTLLPATDTPNNGKQPIQLHQKLILSPIKSGFMLIDQQAAHQRILYERFLQMLDNPAEISAQQKLFPQVLNFAAAESELLKSMLPELVKMGFDIKEFGKNTFIIHATPALLSDYPEQELLNSLLEQQRQNLPLQIETHETIARTFAQQAAIPAGKTLTANEMQSIIDQLFACQSPHKAINGRKTFITLELEEIFRRF